MVLSKNNNLRREIYRLELEIEKQEAALATNRSLLRKFKANLARENPTFPVLTLPPEITSEIFVYCVSEDIEPADYNDPPFVLLRVCKAWNRIAMTTPALWTKIHLKLETSQMPKLMLTLRTMAKRSGQVCLSVKIAGRGYRTHRLGMNAFWSLFGEMSNRIQYLQIDMTSKQLKQLAAVSPAFPSLEHLGMTSLATESLHIFNNTPLLRSLNLSDDLDISRVQLPLGAITRLRASDFSTNRLRLTLQALPNLRFFRGKQAHSRTQETLASVNESVVHPSLCKVYLEEASDLDYMTLPNVEVLEFDCWEYNLNPKFLDRALARANPPLRRMAFWPDTWSGVLILDSLDFLMRTPKLAELELNYPSVGTLNMFCHDFRGREAFLPRIEKLVFRCQSPPREKEGNDYEDAKEARLETFVQDVLNATKDRVVGTPQHPARQVPSFELRIILTAEENDEQVGLVAWSDAQVAQCQEIESRGVKLWIGPESRNLVAMYL
ncbi:F-box domain-containing protein [Mycena kentingensis (nom. inval.)]|nr:F-box domain-containing protein [Mycena kentingensis (nom. inval.)]